MNRRSFLSAALVGLQAKAERPIPGNFANDSASVGHRLRDHSGQPAPRQTVRVPLVIVGGGIAGLSAAWRLQKKGFTDFLVLEMEAQPGGNSRWGQNEVSAYPWAAHYIPVPGERTVLVREMLEDLGAVEDGHWKERFLCFTPQERLFLHGRWQEGLEPEVAATASHRKAMHRFEQTIAELGASGLFTIPMELGAKATHLDQITMRDWMAQQQFGSPYLDWYVDYACRDDYGAHMQDVSAWAGIHYFAARTKQPDKGPLTWPEGNGWIVRQLLHKVSSSLRTNSPVYRVERAGTKLKIWTPDTLYECGQLIFAAPTFLAPYLIPGAEPVPFAYSPWVTANLTLDRMPRDVQNGSTPAWDNVFYDSPSLGYVNAAHMSISSRLPEKSVWTWYMALADGAPKQIRARLLQNDWGYWRDFVLHDIARAHPDIRSCVSRIEVMRMGHAMARPVPGMLSSNIRLRYARATGPIHYANSDLSGFSIFEEAQYRGVTAADRALLLLGR